MKISHRQLEDCRKNPKSWVASVSVPATGRSFGYNQALLFAIHRFHKSGENDARKHLAHLIDMHLSNVHRIEMIESDLDSYIDWASDSNVVIADSKVRVSLAIGGFMEMGGEISRLDITEAGYRAVILGDRSAQWQAELRMPLVQRAVAFKYGRPADEICVATQSLDGTNLEETSFSTKKIAQAEAEFMQLGEIVKKIWPGLP